MGLSFFMYLELLTHFFSIDNARFSYLGNYCLSSVQDLSIHEGRSLVCLVFQLIPGTESLMKGEILIP